MSKLLRVAVLARSPEGEFQLLAPGAKLPKWAAKAIRDSDDVWAGEDRADDVPSEPTPTEASTPTEAASGDADQPGDAAGDEDLIGNTEPDPDAPKGNDTLAAWQAYATTKGATEAELDGLTRAQIREKYLG